MIVRILVTCSLLLLFLGSAQAQEYELKNNFEPGGKSYLTTAITMKGTSHVGENKMPLNMKINTNMIFTVKAVSDDNTATIAITLDKLEMQDQAMGNQKIDLTRMLGLDKQQAIEIEVDQYGYSQEGKALNNVDIPGMSALGQTNSTTKLPWPRLPTQAVSINETWQDEQAIPLQGANEPITKHMTYTLQKVEARDVGQVAVIGIESSIDGEDVTVDPGLTSMKGNSVDFKYTFREYKAKGTGLMEFNIDTGKLLSNYESQDWIIDMGGDVNVNQAEFPSQFRMEYVMETKSTFSDSPPKETAEQ